MPKSSRSHPESTVPCIDVVGLYMNPPDKALVLCVDEKSQIQALDRTQPGLPMKKGRAGDDDPRLQAPRHDDAVRGARRARAAASSASACRATAHRSSSRFLRQHRPQRARALDMHVDPRQLRRPTRHAEVQAWLAKHPRFQLHFTPTVVSWLNLVERFFAEITDEAHPARRVHQRRRAGGRDPGLPRSPQRRSQALRLDQARRGHPGQDEPRPCEGRRYQKRVPSVRVGTRRRDHRSGSFRSPAARAHCSRSDRSHPAIAGTGA